jgi:UDP-glucose 4,6-dehydratase
MLFVKKYPNYCIVNLDKLDYCSSLKNIDSMNSYPNYKFVKGDITSSDLVNYLLTSEDIDTIMHFAAQTHVDNSFGNSITFTQANILGTHVLLEAAKIHSIKLFIHVSTDEVYGEGATGESSHEHVALDPTNPYAATKAGAEYLVKAYRKSFNLPVIITRGNNVYGPHQYPEKIIPKFINQLLRGLPLTLHGSGNNTRNYLHATDVANAFDTILHKGTIGEIYNIGGVNEKSNIDVARSLLKMSGLVEGDNYAAAERKYIVRVEDRPFNDLRYPIENSKLEALGWREQISWDDGLLNTWNWYKEHSNNWGQEAILSAIVAHPRRGYMPVEILKGKPIDTPLSSNDDPVAKIIRSRENSMVEDLLNGSPKR